MRAAPGSPQRRILPVQTHSNHCRDVADVLSFRTPGHLPLRGLPQLPWVWQVDRGGTKSRSGRALYKGDHHCWCSWENCHTCFTCTSTWHKGWRRAGGRTSVCGGVGGANACRPCDFYSPTPALAKKSEVIPIA